MTRASVLATWSKVLWSSFRTITRQSPPNPLPGPRVRGSSTVSVMPALRIAPRSGPGQRLFARLQVAPQALPELVRRGRLLIAGGARGIARGLHPLAHGGLELLELEPGRKLAELLQAAVHG